MTSHDEQAATTGYGKRISNVATSALEELRAAKDSSQAVGVRPKRLFVLDFDCTITREHLWRSYADLGLDMIPIARDTFVDFAALKEFVASVLESGHFVAVATFGRRDVVDKAISYAFGPSHSFAISTPADHFDPSFPSVPGKPKPRCAEGSMALGDKNTQLASLATHFGCSASSITFFDDDAHNIKMAAQAGVVAIHTPSGLTADVLRRIRRDYDLKRRPLLREVARSKPPNLSQVCSSDSPPPMEARPSPSRRRKHAGALGEHSNEPVFLGRTSPPRMCSPSPTEARSSPLVSSSPPVSRLRGASKLKFLVEQESGEGISLGKTSLSHQTSPHQSSPRQTSPRQISPRENSPAPPPPSERIRMRRDSPPTWTWSYPLPPPAPDKPSTQERHVYPPVRLGNRSTLSVSRPRWDGCDTANPSLNDDARPKSKRGGETQVNSNRHASPPVPRRVLPCSSTRRTRDNRLSPCSSNKDIKVTNMHN